MMETGKVRDDTPGFRRLGASRHRDFRDPRPIDCKVWVDGEDTHLHRDPDDGPAVMYDDGSKSWVVRGDRHREDGPAFEGRDSMRIWYAHGTIERTE